MLKLGEQNISGLYLGGEKIEKAYLGKAPVFSAGKPSRLPEGYTEVEYIEATGKQYINTGLYASSSLNIEMDIYVEENRIPYLLGFFNNQSEKYPYTGGPVFEFQIRFQGSDCVFTAANAYKSTTIPPTGSVPSDYKQARIKKVRLNQSSNTFSCDSLSADISNKPETYSNTGNTSIYLFARHQVVKSSKKDQADIFGLFRLLSCKFYNGDTPTRFFVPCTDPSETVGLYDLVNGEFYGSAGTEAFIAGPPI